MTLYCRHCGASADVGDIDATCAACGKLTSWESWPPGTPRPDGPHQSWRLSVADAKFLKRSRIASD